MRQRGRDYIQLSGVGQQCAGGVGGGDRNQFYAVGNSGEIACRNGDAPEAIAVHYRAVIIAIKVNLHRLARVNAYGRAADDQIAAQLLLVKEAIHADRFTNGNHARFACRRGDVNIAGVGG